MLQKLRPGYSQNSGKKGTTEPPFDRVSPKIDKYTHLREGAAEYEIS